jgi:4-diphosphocytidyl-2C-methyl-D-erythritol kinase
VAFNTKNVYSQWDQLKTKSKSISKKTFYNDLQPIVLRNKTLNSLFNKLLKQNKKVMVCGSGGSIIQFNYE